MAEVLLFSFAFSPLLLLGLAIRRGGKRRRFVAVAAMATYLAGAVSLLLVTRWAAHRYQDWLVLVALEQVFSAAFLVASVVILAAGSVKRPTAR